MPFMVWGARQRKRINDVHVLYRKTIDFYMDTMSELVGQTKGDSETVGAINDD